MIILTPLIDFHMNYHTTKKDVNIHYSNLKITTRNIAPSTVAHEIFPSADTPESICIDIRNKRK